MQLEEMSEKGTPLLGGRKVGRLHFITHDLSSRTHAEQAEEACRGGVRVVQLRTKGKEYSSWLRCAVSVKKICDTHGAKLIINDNVAITRDIEAAGVHLGAHDMPVERARETLGEKFIIGGTANTCADVERLLREKVDYIGIGPYRQTATKAVLSPVLGIGGVSVLAHFAASLDPEIPLIAVGGIVETDLEALLTAGVHGVAVSSAIGQAESMRLSAQNFVAVLEECIR
jgi:thiamine-phosphate pyrophosphorylase